MKLKISEIVKASQGKLLCGDENTTVTAFSTDSRNVKKGTMFVPIKGENIDSHIYIDSVFENGAAASFTEEMTTLGDNPVVLVDDNRLALQKTAAYYRSQFNIPVIGITGSAGKTSTKEMVAQALSAKFNVLKTAKNQNSQVGVPVTVCGIKKEHEVAVVEMGISMPGEMARIAAVVKPNFAIVTNIGVSHIEYLKSRENIMAEKLHIADYIKSNGILFVNGDDDLLETLQKNGKHKVVTFGVGANCDCRAGEFNETEKGTFFSCSFKGENVQIFVPAFGVHNIRNALVSFAVARTLGVDSEGAIRAIGAYKTPSRRQEIIKTDDIWVIDDSYNASPDSMRGAVEILANHKAEGKKIAVLADMLELGDTAEKEHFSIGEFAAENKIDYLVGIGELSKFIVDGFNGKNSRHFNGNSEAVAYLKEVLQAGDTVLVKGSRGMKTDEIVSALTK